MSTGKTMSFRAALIWSVILCTAVGLTGTVVALVSAIWPNIYYALQWVLAIAWCVFSFAVVIWAMGNYKDPDLPSMTSTKGKLESTMEDPDDGFY